MNIQRHFFRSPITFTKGWEDHRVIEKALEIKKSDTVVGIVASGDNILNLLLYEPKKIHAFDISITQIYEMKLKLAAIQKLNHTDFLNLLGYQGNKTKRVKIFNFLSKYLDAETYKFWKKNLKMIKKGLSFQGYYEKYSAFCKHPLKLYLGGDFNRFINSENRSERNEIFQKRLNRPGVIFQLNLIRIILSNINYVYKGKVKRSIPSNININKNYWRGLHHYLVDIPSQNNPYRYWSLTGKILEDRRYWPPYLQEENYEKLRRNIHKITIIHSDICNGLKLFNSNSVDKFYLSDIFGWMKNFEQIDKLMSEVVRVAKNNAKIIYFVYSIDKGIPRSIQKYVRTDVEKNKSFLEMDRSGFYHNFYLLDVVK